MKFKFVRQNIKPLLDAISQVDNDRLLFEAIKLYNDSKKYSSGVILWANKEYPNYLLISSALFGDIFKDRTSLFQKDMKIVVDQYYGLIDKVKEKNVKYYDDEIDTSKLILSKQPLQMLTSQDIYIQKFHNELEKVLNTYSSQVKGYSLDVMPVILDFTEEMIKFLIQNENSDLSLEEIEIDLEDVEIMGEIIHKIKKISKIKALKAIIGTWKKTMSRIRKIQNETLTLIPEVNERFKELIEDFKENVDNKSWIKLRLFQIERLDAFIIHFNKFVARLFHILIKSSKDYRPAYIQLKQRSEPRSLLEPILVDMKDEFPDLSGYLSSMLYYFRDQRHRIAHNIDPIIRIYGEKIYLVDPESGEEMEFKIREIEREILAFSYFIESLGLPK